MTTSPRADKPRDDHPELDEAEREAVESNPDPTTQRESLELELMEEGRSDIGADIDLERDIDLDEDVSSRNRASDGSTRRT